MKKYVCTLLAAITTVSLTACGNSISAEDYAAIVSENASLKEEVEFLSDKRDELLKQVLEFHSKQAELIPATSWATTALGENSRCLVDDDYNHLQCIAGNTYPITSEGISNLWSDFLIAQATLSLVQEESPYQTVSVKFLDPSGIYILDIITSFDGTSVTSNSIMCNAMYADIIIPALLNIANP